MKSHKYTLGPINSKFYKCNISSIYNLLRSYNVHCEFCLNFNEYTSTYFKHVELIYLMF